MTASRTDPKPLVTAEARRLAELARAAGFGDSPDAALHGYRSVLSLLGADEPTPLLVDVLRWQGSVWRDRGRTAEAEPLYRQSLQVAESIDYDAGRAHAYNCLAGLSQRRGDLTTAANLLSEALVIAGRCGETQLAGMIQQNLGIIADIRGNPAASLAHYLVALRTFEATNDLQRICWVLINLGFLHAKEDRHADAEAVFTRGVSIARARGDLLCEGLFEENRADLYLQQGRVPEAEAPIARALAIAEQRGDDIRRAASLKLRGALQRMNGDAGASLDTLRQALTFSTMGEDALLSAEVLYQLGLALRAGGQELEALDVLHASLEAFERIAARQWVGRVRQNLSTAATSRYF
jgi:tetratricopeptide (TPR) repeat protein